jgi:hypothetical protein
MGVSHERYRARDLGGNYAEMGKALAGIGYWYSLLMSRKNLTCHITDN